MKKLSWIELTDCLLMLLYVGILVCMVTGCAGIRVSAEIDRVDESQQSSKANSQPLKCLFVDCGVKGS